MRQLEARGSERARHLDRGIHHVPARTRPARRRPGPARRRTQHPCHHRRVTSRSFGMPKSGGVSPSTSATDEPEGPEDVDAGERDGVGGAVRGTRSVRAGHGSTAPLVRGAGVPSVAAPALYVPVRRSVSSVNAGCLVQKSTLERRAAPESSTRTGRTPNRRPCWATGTGHPWGRTTTRAARGASLSAFGP